MTRSYSNYLDGQVKQLLDNLADPKTPPDVYQEVMKTLGNKFGQTIADRCLENSETKVHLACTVEDADYLARGIVETLEESSSNVSFSCFWNKRFSPFGQKDLKISPILKQYQEPIEDDKVHSLIIVKSIISGACVVRTNLTNLIQKIEPEKILIVAPVIYKGAEDRLQSSFKPSIYEKFEFFYFAEDDERTDEGIVMPGIGGDVYQRLGFKDQDDKNRTTPQIVRERRNQLLARIA
ncbi:MAG: hypothetical protein AAGE84_29435 [Cyanobacteria bacterium P01_G01_bin.39]